MLSFNNNNLFFFHISALVRFFDITPLGQILNRFSADTNIIDQVRTNQQLFFFLLVLLWPSSAEVWALSHGDVSTASSSKRVPVSVCCDMQKCNMLVLILISCPLSVSLLHSPCSTFLLHWSLSLGPLFSVSRPSASSLSLHRLSLLPWCPSRWPFTSSRSTSGSHQSESWSKKSEVSVKISHLVYLPLSVAVFLSSVAEIYRT